MADSPIALSPLRRWRWLLFAGGILLAGLLAALTLDFAAPKLGKAVLSQAAKLQGLKLEAEDFRFNLLRGLLLTRVTASGEVAGSWLEVRVERLWCQHRWLPLFVGRVVLDELVLEQPEIEVRPSRAGSKAPTSGVGGGGSGAASGGTAGSPGRLALDFALGRLTVRDGAFTLARTAPPLRVRGITVELTDLATDATTAWLVGLRAQGELAAAEVSGPLPQAHAVTGRVRVQAGHLRVEELHYPTANGPLVAELDVNWNQDPYRYTLTARGEPINTNLLLGAEARGGLGPGRLRLQINGDGKTGSHCQGAGTLEVEGGELPQLVVLAAIEQLLTGRQVIGSAYAPFTLDFKVRGSRIELEPCAIRAGDLVLEMGGHLEVGGPLALTAELTVPREGIVVEELPKEMLEALTDEKGRLHLPLVVRGPPENPQVEFDRRGWRRMAEQRLRHEIREKVGQRIRKWFGGKDGKGAKGKAGGP